MVNEERPEEILANMVRTGLETFKSAVEGITSILRTGDGAIRDLDGALTGSPPSVAATPEEAFLEVVALMQGAVEEAREHGSATTPAVTQRAREILSRVTRQEPAWRPGPSIIKTANDVFRSALRDLRASQQLFKLAQGQGSVDDLDNLSKWADEVSGRLDKLRVVIAQPKPTAPQPAATTASAEAPEAPPQPVTQPQPKRAKRKTTPKKKGNPEGIAFAQAVAEELGDNKVKGWAQEFADGKISERQWINRLTTHASATRDTLDDVFDRATARMAGGKGGKQEGTD